MGNGKKIGISAILIVVLSMSLIALSGCNYALSCEDQSREQLDRCNIDCGEGLGSEICKTNCTAEHNSRLSQCQEQR